MARHSITKYEMACILVGSPAWDGTRDVRWLTGHFSWDELHDLFMELEEAESYYYDGMY